MSGLLLRGGQLAGLVGVLMMVASVVARLTGRYTVGDFQTGTLLLAGTGAVSIGCFLLLWAISERGQR